MSAKKSQRRRTSAKRPSTYHHGDLRAALIRAADEILAQQGIAGFTLREAARRAGVSPAAPAHHFGNSAGLLSKVATLGFEELTRRLQVSGERSPTQRLRDQAMGYVRFAVQFPGRFHLMFRRELLTDDPELLEAGDRAMGELEVTVRQMLGIPQEADLDASARSALLAAWSTVHGFAHLLLDGKLSHMHGGASTDEILVNVLPQMLRQQWPDR